MKLIVRDTNDWLGAVVVAKAYLRDHTDKPVGIRAGVIYFYGSENFYYYVYRTKTAIVVRGVDQ